MKQQYSHLKKRANLTNEQVAHRMQISTVTLHSYINYPKMMRIKHMQVMCELLAIDPNAMLEIILHGRDYEGEVNMEITKIRNETKNKE